MFSDSVSALSPEIILALWAMASLMLAVYTTHDKLAGFILKGTAVLMGFLALWIGFKPDGSFILFNGLLVDDGFGRFCKVLILAGSAIVLLMSEQFLRRVDIMKFEYAPLVALATVGMMIMVSAGDLIALYLGLELQSLALYVIAAFRRDSVRSTEAGLKYFVLGALSSGMLLYGASLIYGTAGTTQFSDIARIAADGDISIGLLTGLVFLLIGMAFKVSAVPFHMWTPDVYEGAPTPVTALFATAPKVAAAGLMGRVLFDAFDGATGDWQQVLAFMSVASIFLGSVAAIGQKDIKRLMAYSSIAHMGFALMGLAGGGEQGAQAMLIYMAIYLVMNLGVFAFILTMERDGEAITDIYALGNFASDFPGRALALAALMFSLAGVPPLVGFWGKFYVIDAAVSGGMFWLAVLGVIGSVIGAYYYLRIVYLMYFGEKTDGPDRPMPLLHGIVLAASAIILSTFWLPGVSLLGVDDAAMAAAQSLFN
ncbi:NADH-quinone oxidoreductase subunit NuoN [Paracoccaceae bacterium GXU_MW_L88]